LRRVETHFPSLIAAGAADMADALDFRAAERPHAPALVLLEHGERAQAAMTYRALHARALAIAAGLSSRMRRGACVVLALPAGTEFVAALFGCFYAGMIAVPAPPPRGTRGRARLEAIAQHCEAALVLTEEVDVALEGAFTPAPRAREDIALLQYTSGSTGAPKGVALSHRAIWANEAVIRTCFDHAEGVTLVGWLPNFHDMGLIGNLLQPIYAGGLSVMMAPTAFTQKPMRWLRAVSDWRAHTSGAPNFAYDLCVRAATPETCMGLDLSHWRVAFNGAEPIRPRTLEAFAQRFAAHGFRRSSMMACYGLAESTLMVAGAPVDEAPHAQRIGDASLVSCGMCVAGADVRVVDGEVLTRGDSLFSGYWKDPAATAQATTEIDGARWLRTGDLGAILDDRLYITGRLKDLMILNGRNVQPADMEAAVEEGLQAHGVLRAAAAGVRGALSEEALIFVEVAREAARVCDPMRLAEAIRRAVAAATESAPGGVVLLKPGAIPLTSSGKVRRGACRDRWLEAGLPGVLYADAGALRLGAARER
jgi:acyl-CoA synthetase (AMP-forming)/AMP-acid ligase II